MSGRPARLAPKDIQRTQQRARIFCKNVINSGYERKYANVAGDLSKYAFGGKQKRGKLADPSQHIGRRGAGRLINNQTLICCISRILNEKPSDVSTIKKKIAAAPSLQT